MTTKYIFGKPEFVDGVGNIYPIKLKDYDEFIEYSNPLYISKSHFDEEFHDLPLLKLLILLRNEEIILNLQTIFTLVTHSNVSFFAKDETNYGFKLESGYVINEQNYETVREIVMKQNLLFEPKVYKDKLLQQIMEKSLQAKAKASIKMEFEDMITTVSVFTGKHYWDLAEYTIYQLKADFNRITKFKNYDTSVIARSVGSDVPVEHYAEKVDLFENPYDLKNFTRSKDSLKNLNDATSK